MGRKRYPAEEIIHKDEADVLLAQGKTVADVCRALEVTDVTYYRWRKEYGGLKVEQVKRMKELERENTQLRNAVSDLTLDKLILSGIAKGKL